MASNQLQEDPYKVGVRQRERQEKMVEYLGEMLIPVTDGFPHINLDMTFTYLSNWDLVTVDNFSTLITYCHVNKLKKAEYMLRGQLATFLNSRRSRSAKSMDMFTTITTKQEQKFEDTTEPQKGFNMFSGFKKKNQG